MVCGSPDIPLHLLRQVPTTTIKLCALCIISQPPNNTTTQIGNIYLTKPSNFAVTGLLPRTKASTPPPLSSPGSGPWWRNSQLLNEGDQRTKEYWRVEMTNIHSLFLRFVWGRTRLPRSIADFRGRDFVLQILDKYNPPDDFLPESYTCFFLLKMPRYSGKAVLRYVSIRVTTCIWTMLHSLYLDLNLQGEVEVRNPLLQVHRHWRLCTGQFAQVCVKLCTDLKVICVNKKVRK